MWFKKKEVKPLSAAEANILSKIAVHQKKSEREKSLLDTILYQTKEGKFEIEFAGSTYFDFYSTSYRVIILDESDILFLTGLGYQVVTAKRDLLLRTYINTTPMYHHNPSEKDFKSYVHYKVSWK